MLYCLACYLLAGLTAFLLSHSVVAHVNKNRLEREMTRAIIQCIESIPPYSEFEDRVSKLKVMCQLYDTYTYILKKKE